MFFTIVKSNTTGTRADLPGFHLGDWVAYVISLFAAGSKSGGRAVWMKGYRQVKIDSWQQETETTDI